MKRRFRFLPFALRSHSPGLNHCSLIMRSLDDYCGSEFGWDFLPHQPPGKIRLPASLPASLVLLCLTALDGRQPRLRPRSPRAGPSRSGLDGRGLQAQAQARKVAAGGHGGRPAPSVTAALASFRAPSPSARHSPRRRPDQPPPPLPSSSPRAFLLPSLRWGRGRRLLLLLTARPPAFTLVRGRTEDGGLPSSLRQVAQSRSSWARRPLGRHLYRAPSTLCPTGTPHRRASARPSAAQRLRPCPSVRPSWSRAQRASPQGPARPPRPANDPGPDFAR